MKRTQLAAVLAVVALAAGVAGYLYFGTAKKDPARALFAQLVPGWQTARARPGSVAGSVAARTMLTAARPWPQVATALSRLDAAWPKYRDVRAAAGATNAALRDAGLRYFLDVQQVTELPIVLTYDLLDRVPWSIGARTVEVVRLRRLDTINVELALFGETDEGLPVVLLDRIEASLRRELPLAFAPANKHTPSRQFNDFDLTALARLGSLLEARVGPDLTGAAALLDKRDTLLEAMRSRFHGGTVQLNSPDGFVLGEEWLDGLSKYTALNRPGGPLLLDTDLRSVTRADEELRGGEASRALLAALDFVAMATEAHEARHALDELDPVAPPPPALFDVMGGSEARFVEMADRELRAYLGELHDSPAPACLSLTKMLRGVYGRGASRTPHFYATVTILRQLDADPSREPSSYLTILCDLPDAELRQRAAAAWQKLYLAPLPPGTRRPAAVAQPAR